jgi:hypothetical protein
MMFLESRMLLCQYSLNNHSNFNVLRWKPPLAYREFGPLAALNTAIAKNAADLYLPDRLD